MAPAQKPIKNIGEKKKERTKKTKKKTQSQTGGRAGMTIQQRKELSRVISVGVIRSGAALLYSTRCKIAGEQPKPQSTRLLGR